MVRRYLAARYLKADDGCSAPRGADRLPQSTYAVSCAAYVGLHRRPAARVVGAGDAQGALRDPFGRCNRRRVCGTVAALTREEAWWTSRCSSTGWG